MFSCVGGTSRTLKTFETLYNLCEFFLFVSSALFDFRLLCIFFYPFFLFLSHCFLLLILDDLYMSVLKVSVQAVVDDFV